MNTTQRYKAVARHYNGGPFDYEMVRLDEYGFIEGEITRRYLSRLVRRESAVADIGAGVGHYAEFLAGRGCRITLVDISRRLLEAARDRLGKAGLSGQIDRAILSSATDLREIGSRSVDVVLCLGPFYHLWTIAERRKAVSEAHRILKPNGILFASAINRMAYLRDAVQNGSKYIRDPKWARQLGALLKKGTLLSGDLSYSYFTDPIDFLGLFERNFRTIGLVGSEAFAISAQSSVARLKRGQRCRWLDLVEKAGRTSAGLWFSDHFLYMGMKKK